MIEFALPSALGARGRGSGPLVIAVWRGAADFQEREVYDMMGVRVKGHRS